VSTELTSQQVLDRAHQAERLLQDPTLQKAFEGVRQGLLARIEEAPLGDRDTHHELALSLQALRSVKRMLTNWVTDGTLEKARNAPGPGNRSIS
jgi:hypothetical protein